MSLWFSDLVSHSVGKQNGFSEIYHVGHDVGDETVVSVKVSMFFTTAIRGHFCSSHSSNEK